MPKGHRSRGSYEGAIGSYASGGKFTLSSVAGLRAGDNWLTFAPDAYSQYLQLALPLSTASGIKDYSATIKGSGTAKSLTLANSAVIDTTKSKFYGSSLRLNPYTSLKHLSGTNDSSLYLTNQDFTIEGWWYMDSTPGYHCLASHSGDTADQQNGWVFVMESSGQGPYFYASSGGGWQIALGTTTTQTTGVWHHYAVTRSGTSVKIFVDGAVAASGTFSVTVANPSTRNFRLGDYVFFPGGERGFNGSVQDFRMYIGVAKYTAAFTPPTRMAV